LRSGTNTRTDKYGGNVENRARFPLEILDIILEIFPASRVGVKLSPINPFNSMTDANPEETIAYVID